MATSDTQQTSTAGQQRQGLRGRISNFVSRLRGTKEEKPSQDRRAFLRKAGATGLAVAAGGAAVSGSASAVGNECGIGRTNDSYLPWNTGGDYGGWRAKEVWGEGGRSRTPVVFVHGNQGDACNFQSAAAELINNGWGGEDVYSITFREGGSNHDEMKRQLDDFVQNVLAETGASEIDIVQHSLGVTGARYWMEEYDRFGWVRKFLGLGGANHGVCVCPGCYDTTLGADYSGILGAGESCQFIAIQCFSVPGHPLYEINLPTETPGNVDYYTMRGIYDPLYSCNIFSPYLDGAENDYAWTDHLGLLDETSAIRYRLS
jgi:pimeloyl-ACP methyl ester carboxylesterase